MMNDLSVMTMDVKGILESKMSKKKKTKIFTAFDPFLAHAERHEFLLWPFPVLIPFQKADHIWKFSEVQEVGHGSDVSWWDC